MQKFCNTSDATIYGFEFEGRYQIRNVELYGNYFWQHPEDDDSGEQLADVPTYRLNIGANFWLADWGKGNIHLLNVGNRARAIGDPRQNADGYSVVNASFIVLDIFKTMELRTSIYNIFDQTYAYPAPGRNFFFEVSYTF